MKIEVGKKYKTRNGDNVRIYAVDGVGVKKVHGAIFDGEGFYSNDWHEDGSFRRDGDGESDLDLVEVKEDWERLADKCEYNEVFIVHEGAIYLISYIDLLEDDDIQNSHLDDSEEKNNYFKAFYGGSSIIIKKDSFKFATKEEVIEYFFGEEK